MRYQDAPGAMAEGGDSGASGSNWLGNLPGETRESACQIDTSLLDTVGLAAHRPHSCHPLRSAEAGILKTNELSECFSIPFSSPAHCPGAPSISVKLPLLYIVLLDFQLPVNDWIPF